MAFLYCKGRRKAEAPKSPIYKVQNLEVRQCKGNRSMILNPVPSMYRPYTAKAALILQSFTLPEPTLKAIQPSYHMSI